MTTTVAPLVDERLEYAQQRPHVERVQADGRLVEDEHRESSCAAAHLAGELEPLRLAAGETGRRFAEGEVAQAQIMQRAAVAGIPASCRRQEASAVVDAPCAMSCGQGMALRRPCGSLNTCAASRQ